MLLHARSTLVLSALAVLVACNKDGPLEPVGGPFSLGPALAVGRGREARVLGGSTGGTFVAVVVNLGLDTLGKSGYSLRATDVQEAPRGPFSARVPRPDDWRAETADRKSVV